MLKSLPGQKRPFSQSAIIEDDYFDEDFVGGISAFYSKGFRDVYRICKRIHFFSCSSRRLDLRDLSKVQDSYLGFSVIRPLQTKTVGRTVLKPTRVDPQTEFHTCCADFKVNVAGTSLTIKSAPFVEQDGRVQTCSSIAIYISTSTMAHCFAFPQYTTSEIMDKAVKILVGPRAGPTMGLSYDQMMSALREMGYDPIRFWEADSPEAAYRIYSYVESGIPPILLLEMPNGAGHAVTALGHGHNRPITPQWQARVSWLNTNILAYFRSSEWVPHFYVHDDQRGTFRKLRFLDMNPQQLRQAITTEHANASLPVEIKDGVLEAWHCPVAIHIDIPKPSILQMEIANLWGIIVPIPRGITLSHSEAESKTAWVIKNCADSLGLSIPNDLVLRTYLTRSNDYKERLNHSNTVHSFIRALYRGKSMPKWLWLTEISRVGLMNTNSVGDIRIMGELLLDATGNPWPTDFMVFHWIDDNNDGLVTTMTREDEDISEAITAGWRIPNEGVYPPLIR